LLSPTQVASALTTLARQLLESWKDRTYRAEFVRERVRSSIALQIRALREQRNHMTQAQLGQLMGKEQPWISQLEDPEYGKMSVATLLSLAEAFDTDLEIKFRPFSRSLNELVHQGPDYFQVRSFDEELPDLENAGNLAWIPALDGSLSDIRRAANLLFPQSAVAPLERSSGIKGTPIAGDGIRSIPSPSNTPDAPHPLATGQMKIRAVV
jgi:transcriptional regulator with XRE-family HTH domain